MPRTTGRKPKFPHLKWNFDVKTFALLGSELITDRITALVELSKNAYDANAKRLEVIFVGAQNGANPSQIMITDDGEGMSYDDISRKWMVIGTGSKRASQYSAAPFNRRFIGEKGVGRFAVEKLGKTLILKTKQNGDRYWNYLEIDWKLYAAVAAKSDGTFFTDIPNRYWKRKGNVDESGTTLIIKELNDLWTEHDIDRSYKELSKIVSPLQKIDPPFEILIKRDSNDLGIKVVNHAITFATIEKHLTFDPEKQATLVVKDGRLEVEYEEIKSFGPIGIHLFYFNREDKSRFTRAYKGTAVQIDGVKIYRDGIIATPFAQHEDSSDRKRDILGIDKRRWSDFFEKISSRDLIGFVEISKDHNPLIIDATNRQDFLDNQQYRDLKDFIISQIFEIEKFLKSQKEIDDREISTELKGAKSDLLDFSTTIKELANQNPELSSELKKLGQQAKKVQISLKKGIKAHDDLKKESIRKENLYLSLMSLQEYSAHLAHAVRTALSRIKSYAEFFKREYPNEKYDKYFKKYSINIYEEMIRLDGAVNFMLSYAASNAELVEFNLKDVISEVFKAHDPIFIQEKINLDLDIKDPVLLYHNRKFVDDIFENLISNSVKALKCTDEKSIKCTGYADSDKYIVYFSDNGVGIPLANRKKVFEIYFTTTSSDGGAGLGLYVVKTRVNALKGTISITDPEYAPTGVTFRLEIPFKQEGL